MRPSDRTDTTWWAWATTPSCGCRSQKRALRSVTAYGPGPYGMAFSPDGRTVAVGAANEPLRLWDVRTGQNVATVDAARGTRTVAFHPGGSILAGATDAAVSLWTVTIRG
jgi:WD40 repeat protein